MRIYAELIPWSIFFIIVGSIVLLSALLFFLTSMFIVKKDRVAIIEKAGSYIGLFYKGVYFFNPFITRRVGYYKIDETKIKFDLKSDTYILKFQIVDFVKYHYEGGHDAIGIVKASLGKDDVSRLLIDRFNNVGAKFVSLEKVVKRR